MRRLIWAAGVAVAVTVGCEHGRTDELTASEHRRRAEDLTQQAQSERAKYNPIAGQEGKNGSPFNPNGTDRIASRTPFSEGPDGVTKPYNPTEAHLAAADRAMREAAKESAAARKLEGFENVACVAIPREQRAACPLLASQVKAFINTADGVELTLRDDVNTLDTVRHLQCHLAYARVNGFEQPSCPLFTRGMSIEIEGLHGVALKGTAQDVVQRIQEQAGRVFRGEPAPEPLGER